MTDNEIIKALDCCAKLNCKICPCNFYDHCQINLFEIATFVKRQQSEIERLKGVANDYQNMWGEAVSDLQAVKNEAIKEFAERLKANKDKLFNYIYSERGFDEQIDSLVKEMTGKEDENA